MPKTIKVELTEKQHELLLELIEWSLQTGWFRDNGRDRSKGSAASLFALLRKLQKLKKGTCNEVGSTSR